MIADLQQAVVGLIQAKTGSETPYSQAITPQVAYLPADDLANLSGIQVYVAPSMLTSEIATRTTEETTSAVDVAVVKKLATADRTTQAWRDEMAAMLLLVDEIAKSLRFTEAGSSTWKQSQIAPIYDAARLRETGVFLSVVRVTYWIQE